MNRQRGDFAGGLHGDGGLGEVFTYHKAKRHP